MKKGTKRERVKEGQTEGKREREIKMGSESKKEGERERAKEIRTERGRVKEGKRERETPI